MKKVYKREQFIGVAILALVAVLCTAYGEQQLDTEQQPQKAVIAVPMPKEDCWQDFSFLAAVPASAKQNNGTPVVLALEQNGTFRPETSDFLARYKPDSLYMLDCTSPQEKKIEVSDDNTILIPAKDLDSAACSIASRFWTNAATAVCCSESNYEDAVIASALAARLQAPLVFSGKAGLTQSVSQTLKTLQTSTLIFIGDNAPALPDFQILHLPTAADVLSRMKKNGMALDYLAVFNPHDRDMGWVRKISLAAPLLAAGRNGMVVPLDFDTEWKVPFNTKDPEPGQKQGGKALAHARQGTIEINGVQAPFVMACSDRRHDKASCMANWAEGKCPKNMHLVNKDGSLLGPYASGDRIKLGDRYYTISLDPESGVGKADLWLTWPGVPEIRERLSETYKVIGGHPEYLCLLGWPDMLPKAVLTHRGGRVDITSDRPFANADDDRFIEIALGRLIGEDVYSAVLTATRGLAYEDLKTGDWPSRFGLAGWGDSDRNLENVGFTMVPYHDVYANKHTNNRIRQHSPLTEVATIKHGAHSGWRSFGGFYGMRSPVLLAPAIVESGGCSTMRVDQNAEGRSAPARLLRNGAVCVLGNERNGKSEQNLYRSELWSGIAQDMSVGRAHRYALNRALLAVLDADQKEDGNLRYQFYIRALYGDPALHLSLPHGPASRPAYCDVSGTKVTAHAPETWWESSTQLNKSWNSKHEIQYSVQGAGVGSQRHWSHSERCNLTKQCYAVELRTSYHVKAVEQIEKLPEPLGWNGKYWIDEHQDGSRSIFWRVRFVDYDQFAGKFRHQTDSISYRLLMGMPNREVSSAR